MDINYNSYISQLFDPIKETKYISKKKYKTFSKYLYYLHSVSKLTSLSYYIIDYYRKNFFYVSECPLFLNGYTQKEVMDLGFEYYTRCVPGEDLELLLDINESGFRFFYDLPIRRRLNACISYDFRIRHKTKNSMVLINHKLSPILLSSEGNIWMALCLVRLSSMDRPGTVYIYMQDKKKRYNFNRKKKLFEWAEPIVLSAREKEILTNIALGYKIKEISGKLGIAASTVKTHKRNIFRKLHVTTSSEAVYHALTQDML